ncbi:MAG TPA: lytic transglycosylase domain-containing protein [Caulobacteraceae bacterium]|nr:lytic transglycosylase domain-containing protein [Caulobacteraceae bacterium]
MVLTWSVADAQTNPRPYTPAPAAPAPAPRPYVAPAGPLSTSDASFLSQAISQAKAGNLGAAMSARNGIREPLARKIATWQITESLAEQMSFYEIDTARKELAGFPRHAKRQAAAERLLETSGMDANRIILWFGDTKPETAQGVMALASAYRMSGRAAEAANLVRTFWREQPFEADIQRQYLARFGDVLRPEDHIARADMLLYGPQGPATQDIVALLPEPHRTEGQVRMALRAGASDANDQLARLTPQQLLQPGVAYERAAYLRGKGLDALALALAPQFGKPPTQEAAIRIWPGRRALIGTALRAANYRAAYELAADTGMTTGVEAAEAEFYAGWIALTRLKNPQLAAKHFAGIEAAGGSPITMGRAHYWQGRAAEAMGDTARAQAYYRQGAEHLTTFYGQLAAEKVGLKTLDLGKDPIPTAEERARFESREPVRAARILSQIGEQNAFRVFVLHVDDVIPTAGEQALLVDLARGVGGAELAMRVVRAGAQRGLILPERGYPVITPPYVPGGAEPAFVLSISRQESNFDPYARSSVGARGMMQLMPATAELVARQIGESHSAERLTEPVYNMRLGSTYLGDLISQFDGSYIMAAAGYNAGPGRPRQWSNYCGDPRGAATDPLDFIECIPFSETRNYVMRTLETTQVYRARLAGGSTPLRLSADLNRGAYNYAANTASGAR